METVKEIVYDFIIAALMLAVVTAQGVVSNKGLSCGGQRAEVKAAPSR